VLLQRKNRMFSETQLYRLNKINIVKIFQIEFRLYKENQRMHVFGTQHC